MSEQEQVYLPATKELAEQRKRLAPVNCAAVYKATRPEEVTAADARHNFEANLLEAVSELSCAS